MVTHCINKALNIEIKVIKLILERPKAVLFDSILQLCSKADAWLVSEVLLLFKHVDVTVDPIYTFQNIVTFVQDNIGVEEGISAASQGEQDIVTPN